VEHGETAGLYEAAEAKVVGEIIRTQETAVDGVTGATRTGDGIKEAVEAALADAR